MHTEEKELSCAECATLNCHKHESRYPKFCLTSNVETSMLDASLACYQEEGMDRTIALAAAEIEGKYYGTLTRVEEILAFARRIGARKIGIASCVGLVNESQIFAEILKINGFDVFMAICKVGSRDKIEIGLQEAQKIRPNTFEPMCNPVLQAKYVNKAKTDLNVIMGLCVGHDSLFIKYAKAPITYLVVKDRVLGHNPIAALHLTKTYYKKLLTPREL
ncbi:DUF1847 domain-containing protein [Sulfurospirillum sp. hDNRA2]|uniref:DUF1847 domain-containing protein n=1 Tax=Sulfurospirillum sp. hDNRA2 TaxID=3237298 RepID=UPI0020B735ED|nr:DUF1847 domain-containing protein [Sulfurospirillum sp. DNRA8]MCP3651091.1 DUF1847 domain-containing protein [Sulfurospirillum sp. DNRA8]MCR1809937.1 DUF1847 domain-containing protein [Sulfurospirillum sp. DNRA8]